MQANNNMGWQFFIEGAGLIFSAPYRFYVLIPILLNMLLLSALSYYGVMTLDKLLGDFSNWLPEFLRWLYFILMPLAVISFLIVISLFFTFFLSLLASPFNGFLCERVEREMGLPAVEESLSSVLARVLPREFAKLWYILPRYIGLLLLSFVPVLNLVAPLLWFWFGGWLMAFQYLDYSFDSHQKSIKELRAAMLQQRVSVVSFGIPVLLLMSIPVVNWFIMPAAVIGATRYRVMRMPFNNLLQ